MFNPQVGAVVMALASIACVGSLLGWQFVLVQTAKDAADSRMFPRIFGRTNRMGAPIAGMVIMGVVQSVLALSTISPNLSKQFSILADLSVVTCVVPYIIALSALPVMMRNAGTVRTVFQRNVLVALIAMLYSVYSLYAAGKDAVMGGMVVMALGFVLFGLVAPRFVAAPPVAPVPGRAS
jgi:putrescine:ornithine antiporter